VTIFPAEPRQSTYSVRHELRSGLASEWADKNPVLREGEPGIESDTGKFKLGDGFSHYNDLQYYLRADHVSALVQQMLDALPGGGGGGEGVSVAAFQAHVDSENPHLTYDDGTSFTLRYENAKV
jgi:hypothetical protein